MGPLGFLAEGNDGDVLTLDSAEELGMKWAAGGGGGGGGTWGSITGTLADQTDLQAALNARQPLNDMLTSFAGLVPAAGTEMLYAVGGGPADIRSAPVSSAALDLLAETSIADMRSYLGAAASDNLAATSAITLTGDGMSVVPFVVDGSGQNAQFAMQNNLLGGSVVVENSLLTSLRTLQWPDASGILVATASLGSGTELLMRAGPHLIGPVTGSSVSGGGLTLGGALTLGANGAASTPPLLLSGTWFTGGTATTTKPQMLVEPSGTTSTGWSTSGTGLGINAASGFTGNLLDLQIAGARAARFYPSGNGSLLTLSDRVTTHAFATLQASNVLNCVKGGDGGATRWALGQQVDSGLNSGLLVESSYIIGFTSGTVSGSSADVKLVRDGAGILAQRNSTNAQSHKVYGTYTDSSNYTRLSLAATSTTMAIAAETAGTGADDIDLALTPAGAGNVKFGTYSALGAEGPGEQTGYITIKDSAGNTRKLAVVS